MIYSIKARIDGRMITLETLSERDVGNQAYVKIRWLADMLREGGDFDLVWICAATI